MKRKLLALLLCLAILASCLAVFTACSKKKSTKTLIAVVTDIGELFDHGFNENTFEGVKDYAEANGHEYKHYAVNISTDNSDEAATEAAREAAMRRAINDGAKIIVAPGFSQENAIKKVAVEYPSVKFIFVDGNSTLGLDNVTIVSFKEEESGFIAGYSAVKEGCNKIGGTFGGGGIDAACNRFAYGYLQGAIAAASGRNDVMVKISYKYGENFAPSLDLENQMKEWYDNEKGGIQMVFACGGEMFQSVKNAAESFGSGHWIIGVDVDQSPLSPRVVTSAIKRLDEAVKLVLGKYFNGEWDTQLANRIVKLGAKENATGITDSPWRFRTYSIDEYYNMYDAMKEGSFRPLSEVPENCNDATWWAERTSFLNDYYLSSVTVIFEA